MVITLEVEVAGENKDYGSTYDDEDLVVPFRQPPNRPPPSSWNTKKVVLGLIMGVMATTLFVAVLRDAASAGPSAIHTGPEAELLQFYPYVTITNKTPLDLRPPQEVSFSVKYKGGPLFCDSDFLMEGMEGLAAGETWTASSRGLCLVKTLRARLGYHRPNNRSQDFSPLCQFTTDERFGKC